MNENKQQHKNQVQGADGTLSKLEWVTGLRNHRWLMWTCSRGRVLVGENVLSTSCLLANSVVVASRAVGITGTWREGSLQQ